MMRWISFSSPLILAAGHHLLTIKA